MHSEFITALPAILLLISSWMIIKGYSQPISPSPEEKFKIMMAKIDIELDETADHFLYSPGILIEEHDKYNQDREDFRS